MPVQLPAGQLVPPAPECPQGQWPCRPGEPEQQPAQALPFLAAVPGPDQPPAPQAQLPGQQGDGTGHQQDGNGPRPAPVAGCIVAMGLAGAEHGATKAKKHGHAGRATQHQPGQSRHQPQGWAQGAVGHTCNGVEHHGGAAQLGQVGGDFVGELGQAQAGDQCQQATIGHGACVVGGLCFTTEGKGHGLRLRPACQVVHRIPGGHQRQGQQHGEWNTRSHFSRDPSGRSQDGGSAQPVGQQAIGFRGHAQDQGVEPGRLPLRQRQHVAERGDVIVLPDGAAHKPGDHIGHAQHQQCGPGQGAHGTLGDDGGGRVVHASKGGGSTE